VSNTALALVITGWFSACLRAQWPFVFLTLLLVLCPSEGRAQQEGFDRESYYRAVEYCRGDVSRPMALSSDRGILCFDGILARDLDLSQARDLREDGLIVVRSPGGNAAPAIVLSDLIRDRHATVVVYDYCFSACAVFLLIASHRTYVLRGSLVVWHNPNSSDPNHPYCTALTAPRGGGPKKLQRGPCRDGTFEAALSSAWPEVNRFFKYRAVDPLFEAPSDSLYVRTIVRNLYAETGVYRDIGWTLNPRYYPRLFKAKILYEAYPESQDEVDDMLARLHMKWKVIYDP